LNVKKNPLIDIFSIGQVLTAYPAPIVFALAARHVHATRVFLDRHLALGTPMSADHICPSFVILLLGLLARLPFVPFGRAIKAHFTLARIALYLFGVFRSLHDLLAISIGTEFFVV
jgi:hypothetical protein